MARKSEIEQIFGSILAIIVFIMISKVLIQSSTQVSGLFVAMMIIFILGIALIGIALIMRIIQIINKGLK